MTDIAGEGRAAATRLKNGFQIEACLEIAAGLEEVFETALDVKTWPGWVGIVRSVKLKGERLELGSVFSMNVVIKGIFLPLRLKVVEYEALKNAAWEAGHKAVGFYALRGLAFEKSGERTIVTSIEEFTGFGSRFMRLLINENDLVMAHQDWLKDIAREVGRRQGG